MMVMADRMADDDVDERQEGRVLRQKHASQPASKQ